MGSRHKIDKDGGKTREQFGMYDTLFLAELFNGDENMLKELNSSFMIRETASEDEIIKNNKILFNEDRELPNGYRPAVIRGAGALREGYCARCDQWFKLKTSSYWYHMNYKHGISAKGRICPEPKLRERMGQKEGFCKECREWIVLGINNRSVRFGWFKHWQKLHCKGKSI